MQTVLVFADPEVPAALQVGFVLHFQLDCAAHTVLMQEELWGHGQVLYFMLASMLLPLRVQPPPQLSASWKDVLFAAPKLLKQQQQLQLRCGEGVKSKAELLPILCKTF